MAKRYELSDEAWTVVADLFTEVILPERSPDARWGALGTLLGCCVARYAGTLQPVVNGVSTVSGLAKPGNIRSDAQTLAPEIE